MNRWVTEKWETKGVLQDLGAPGAAPQVIVEHEGLTQMLYPGLRLRLQRDEAEGYYLNLTSPEPKVFVLWRMVDEIARPEMLTVSYGEGARWADSGEQVDGDEIAYRTEHISRATCHAVSEFALTRCFLRISAGSSRNSSAILSR